MRGVLQRMTIDRGERIPVTKTGPIRDTSRDDLLDEKSRFRTGRNPQALIIPLNGIHENIEEMRTTQTQRQDRSESSHYAHKTG